MKGDDGLKVWRVLLVLPIGLAVVVLVVAIAALGTAGCAVSAAGSFLRREVSRRNWL